jgi:rhamnose utilization protein RhaD (predicted bifunctional aldolase and dehydrogenase)
MPNYKEVLNQLIALSRSLGAPARDLVILGEGNASAKVDEEVFLVKASGEELGTASERSFVAVSQPLVLRAFNLETVDDESVRSVLVEAKIHPEGTALPSVETFLHAYLLSLPGIQFVAHTHPAAINAILCSVNSREAVRGRLFPDEIVCCGPAVCYVEYADPGIPLARQLRRRVEEFIDEHNMPPKVVLMENHGLIACGLTSRDIETITSMYVKVARVLLGTFSLGGPRFLSHENVYRIHTRPDEHYRQKQLAGKEQS